MWNVELTSRRQFQTPNSKFQIAVLGSGSKGNCYAFSDGKATVQLECGLPIAKTLAMLNWQLPDAILVTHEHCDHGRYAEKFLERGVEIYMTAGTAQALKIKRHNLHLIKPNEIFDVCGHQVTALEVKHDAAEPVNFIVDDTLFITDVGEIPEVKGNFRRVLIEANYDIASLLGADINDRQKRRIRENHLSIKQTCDFLKTIDEPDEVRLIHISSRHGDGADFVERVKRVTNFRNVFAAEVTL